MGKALLEIALVRILSNLGSSNAAQTKVYATKIREL